MKSDIGKLGNLQRGGGNVGFNLKAPNFTLLIVSIAIILSFWGGLMMGLTHTNPAKLLCAFLLLAGGFSMGWAYQKLKH